MTVNEGPWKIGGQEFRFAEIVGITEGPWTNFTGELKGIDVDKAKATVMVIIFGRPLLTYLGFGGIEKITLDRYIVRLKNDYLRPLILPSGEVVPGP